jgi:coenzyme F420-reducing hydrogenase delta subunit
MAGVSRLRYPMNILPIRVMCSSRIDPLFILHALRRGADGVLVTGCHPGDCYYVKGNLYMRRRLAVLRKLLEYVGIAPERVQVSWISAAEAQRFANIIARVVEDVKNLGPQEQLREVK